MRVKVIKEVRTGEADGWQLCFQWCCYAHEERDAEWGYRFIGRHSDGSLQPARGQARINDQSKIANLLTQAKDWLDRDGDKLAEAVKRLTDAGLVVSPWSGSVLWPNKESALKGHLSPETIEDAQLLTQWC